MRTRGSSTFGGSTERLRNRRAGRICASNPARAPDEQGCRLFERVYARTKKALEYLIAQDANEDGIIQNAQHNTLDVDLYGASSWLSSIYLAALRAGAQMADEMEDKAFAERCRHIADAGCETFQTGSGTATTLFKGWIWGAIPTPFGTGTAAKSTGHGSAVGLQVGLPRVLDLEKTRKALAALYRNNFLP